MKDAQKIALIASFLLRYPDEQWYNELPEWREDAQSVGHPQLRQGLLEFFDYVEAANKKEFEDQYVRTFDFSQNTTMYLSTYELQGTGEECPFSRKDLEKLLELGEKGNKMLLKAQREALGEIADEILGVDYGNDVVIATGNAHKLEEIGDILKDLDYNIYSLKDVDLGGLEIEENGKTFEHNALIKAREVAKRTKMITIADDSGLEVDAIGKKPGIYSARYAGENATDEENRAKLLKSLGNTPMSQRGARFVCCIAVVFPDGKEFVVRGTCEGTIGFEEKGSNGFGYDNLFIVNKYDKTFAELPATIKNAISHRANALQLMKEELSRRVGR